MKKSMATLASLVIGLVLCAACLVNGQNQVKPNFSGLGLKIRANKGTQGSIRPVPASGWFVGFDRIEGAPQDEESRAEAIHFACKVDGDAVRVDIAILKTKFMTVSEPVGTFLVHLDETVTVNELTRFGVVPIDLSIVKVNPEVAADLPTVDNKIKSLEFVNVEASDPEAQSYWISFRNNSSKSLYELGIETFIKERKVTISWPRGEQYRQLAGPGEVFRIKVKGAAAGKKTDDGYAYSPITRVAVLHAIFQDDTFEGDPASSMSSIAMRNGHRDQLAVIVAILGKTLTSPAANAPNAIEALRSEVASLPVEADEAVMREFRVKFSITSKTLPASLSGSYAIAMNGTKHDFIVDLEKFKNGNGSPNFTGDFHKWLVDAKTRYQEWLDRLQ